jgi:hypothetical protein
MLKLRPFEDYVGTGSVQLYVGIRADEPHRTGYVSTKPNIHPRFPFVEDGLTHRDILRILDESGLGMPEYYKWRSRSGCYFCFFQQRREWVGLLERHPDLYWKAAGFEKYDPSTGQSFTWVQGESLHELAKPERVQQIKEDFEKRRKTFVDRGGSGTLQDVFASDPSQEGCLVCHL